MTQTSLPAKTPVAVPPEDRGVNPVRRTLDLFLHYPMVVVFGLLLAFTSIVNPRFWDTVNLQNLIVQNVSLLVVAIGVTFVLIAGGFDLSTGAIFAACAIVYLSLDDKMSAPVALLVVLALGAAIGATNGFIVNACRINPFIATLATSSVITGGMTLYYGDNVRYQTTESFAYIGNTKYFDWLPLSFIIAMVLLVVGGLILARSTFGRAVYAVGGNREAARLNGVRVGLISGITFTILGVMAALGGIFTASLLGTAQPSAGATVTLDAIAIVIIGGTSFLGGEGAMWRTFVGLGIVAVMQNLFTTQNYDPSLQMVFKGIIVLLAVAADVWFRKSSRA